MDKLLALAYRLETSVDVTTIAAFVAMALVVIINPVVAQYLASFFSPHAAIQFLA